jgi:DNA/RNA-binding domain of Phe-tRNA-synthetase-like protein
MTYTIGEQIFSLFPHFQRGVVVGKNINNNCQHQELAARLSQEVTRIAENGNLLADPRLDAWDHAYRIFGADPKRDTPSIRFLIQQISKRKGMRSINDLVNAFNITSLKYRIPCGGDDLDALNGGDIRLDLATGTETFAPLFKPDNVENPSPGEVIYFTTEGNRVMCRRWNWRNAHFSRIRPETTNVAINVDALVPPISRTVLEQATEELATLVRQYCGGEITTHILDASCPSFTV